MNRRSLTVTTTLSLVTPFAAIALMSSDAEAATPTYYNNAPAYQAVLGPSVTDDYSNPGYVFIQNNATMNAVIGETDYETTGHNNLNIVQGDDTYCAGCNGSFRLSFQTTTVGTAQGVFGVGFNINVNSAALPYNAFITFADGDTENVALPPNASYFAVTAPEQIQSIHFGLANGGATTGGSFVIDNLQIGGFPPVEVCNGAGLDLSTLTPGSGATVTQLGTTAGAADNIDETAQVACWLFNDAAEHVYQFTVAESTFLQIDTDGSAYDTKLGVVNGCPSGNIFCQYNDDFGGDFDSGFACTEYAPGTYSAIVSGFNTATGAYALNLTECAPCGNGILDPGEECDTDGESATCNIDCTNAVCGDGYINAAAMETCDDSGESATCDSDCTAASCGDAILNMTAGEACDDGAESETCNGNCTVSSCGDGITNAAAAEECDLAGEAASCDDDCTGVSCGDNNVNQTAGETCDDGGRSAMCNANCTAASCGDGIFNAASGEECDGDGNGNPGQTATCDDDCTNAMCGDGVVNDLAGEECDDGGESEACDLDCTAASCGDGTINEALAEECDDGNTDDDDGCSAACEIEDEPGTSSGGEESSSGGEDSSGGETTDTSDDTSGPSTETDPTEADTSGSASGSASATDTDDAEDSSDTNDSDGEESSGSEGATGGTADDGGCGCTTDDRRGSAWSFLGLFGLGALLRRRRRA